MERKDYSKLFKSFYDKFYPNENKIIFYKTMTFIINIFLILPVSGVFMYIYTEKSNNVFNCRWFKFCSCIILILAIVHLTYLINTFKNHSKKISNKSELDTCIYEYLKNEGFYKEEYIQLLIEMNKDDINYEDTFEASGIDIVKKIIGFSKDIFIMLISCIISSQFNEKNDSELLGCMFLIILLLSGYVMVRIAFALNKEIDQNIGDIACKYQLKNRLIIILTNFQIENRYNKSNKNLPKQTSCYTHKRV